jgi:iron complex outermembrane receptor protein
MNERYIRFAGSAVLILSGLALVTTGVARGDEPADKTDETPDREESTFREEIEVIAEGPDFEIQRLEIEELESGRAANLAVALQTIPAVAGVRRAQNALEPVIRGLGWERVQTQLNGVPLYGACPARMDSPATLVAASAVREASVIKGLSSVTFGPAGTGGRVMVSTELDRGAGAGREIAPWARLGYDGARDGYQGGAGVAGGTERVDYSLGLETLDHGDYDSADGTTVPANHEETGAFFSFANRVATAHRWSIGGVYQKGERIDYPSLPMNTDESETWIYNARYSYRPTDDRGPLTEIEWRLGLSNVDHLMSNRGKPNRPVLEAETVSDADAASTGLVTHWLVSPRSVLKTGLDFTGLDRDAVRERRIVATDAVFYDHLWPDVAQDDLGLYAEYSLVHRSDWRLRFGLRYDAVSSEAAAADDPGLGGNTIRENYVRFYGAEAADTDRDEDLVSGNVVVSRELTGPLTLQGGLGLVSRAAAMTERYFSFAPGPNGFVVGNPTLDAEQKWEASVGATLAGSRVAGSVSAYYYAFDDYIVGIVLAEEDVNGDGATDLIRGFENVEATLSGVELSGIYRPTGRLSFPAALVYVRGENKETHTPLPEIPALEGRLAGRVSFGGRLPGWVELGGRFVDEQDRVDESFGENPTPGYAVWHLRGGVAIARYLALEGGVENLFDKQYHEHLTREAAMPSGNLAAGDEIPQPGRSVVVGLSFKY